MLGECIWQSEAHFCQAVSAVLLFLIALRKQTKTMLQGFASRTRARCKAFLWVVNRRVLHPPTLSFQLGTGLLLAVRYRSTMQSLSVCERRGMLAEDGGVLWRTLWSVVHSCYISQSADTHTL